MKLTTFPIITTFLAAAMPVGGAVVQDLDKRYCLSEGQPCDTVKRATEAFADVVKRDNADLAARSFEGEGEGEADGQISWIASRQLHELAVAIAASHDDPAAFFRALGFHGSPTEPETPTEVKREAEPWCTRFLGQPCWKKRKDKRDADPYCVQAAGQPCWNKRAAATAPTPVKRAPEPWCTDFLGQPCWKRGDNSNNGNDDDKEKRAVDIAPTPVKREPEPWCTDFLGQPCWKRGDSTITTTTTTTTAAEVEKNKKKREASAVAVAEPDRYCSRFTGSSCWKRDGGAEAAEEVRRCTAEGRVCWRAKRAAAAVINAIDAGNAAKMARDADPGWCKQFLGMPCWKRAASCDAPRGGICAKATRDLHAMYNAARSIIES